MLRYPRIRAQRFIAEAKNEFAPCYEDDSHRSATHRGRGRFRLNQVGPPGTMAVDCQTQKPIWQEEALLTRLKVGLKVIVMNRSIQSKTDSVRRVRWPLEVGWIGNVGLI